MFRKPTLFVIGAGAGVELEMCTGAMLLDYLSKSLNIRLDDDWNTKLVSGDAHIRKVLIQYAKEKETGVAEFYAAGRRISEGVHHAKSIDSFIHNHRDDEKIKLCGKIGIVQAIAAYEQGCYLFIDETKRPLRYRNQVGARRSWLQELMHILGEGIDAKETLDQIFKNIAIINFNYDRCVEHFLWHSLREQFGVDETRATELMSKLLIHHPYGVIAPLPWQSHKGYPLGGGGLVDYVDLLRCAKNIRTYNEEVQGSDDLQKVCKFMGEAIRIVYLGFHFHRQNIELIKPIAPQEKHVKHVYVTTYGRSNADKELIQNQMGATLQPVSNETYFHMAAKGCKELFEQYGATLAN